MDYDVPAEVAQRNRESSAAAIMAAGLLRLREAERRSDQGAIYGQSAKRMLVTLCGPPYLASETPGWEGILREGIYHLDKGLGVGESVMWGEYFFARRWSGRCGDSVDFVRALSLASLG